MSSESYLDPHPRHREPWSVGRSFDYLNGKGHGLPAMWTEGRFLAFHGEVDHALARRWPLAGFVRPTWLLRAYQFRSW